MNQSIRSADSAHQQARTSSGTARKAVLRPRRPFILATAALLTLATTLMAAAPTGAATINVSPQDLPGEGFFDPTPVTAVGGNAGLTLGDQRVAALEFAASIWAVALTSSVDIEIQAIMAAGTCAGGQANVIASSGPGSVHRDFPGATIDETWYPQALANRLSASDLDPALPDVTMQFSKVLDGACTLGPWYYGLDEVTPPGSIDFVSVALHEIGHGLGMASFVDSFSGALFVGYKDIYSAGLEDHTNGLLFASMSDDERFAALRSPGDLHWVGPLVRDAAVGKVGGIGAGGHVEMYAATGSKVTSAASHLSTTLDANESLEPFYLGPNHDPGLALDILNEIGWADPVGSCGDGVLDPLEECDDSNLEYGDCCSALCTLEGSGTSCAADGETCRADTCNGAGTCILAFKTAGTSCADADACTIATTCDGAGTCEGGGAIDCNDEQACTTEVCDSGLGCVYTPTAEPCTGEFIVNTTRIGSQVSPVVAADLSGDFIVVWNDFDLELSRPALLAAQRFTAAGVRMGPEIVVYSDDDNTAGPPEVCIDDDGDAIVVWEGDGLDDDTDVFARRLPSDGATDTPIVLVNTTTDFEQTDPEVACAPDGSFVVVWTSENPDEIDNDGSEHGVLFQRFDATGARVGDETQANATTTGRQWGPSVAVATDGTFLLAWASGCAETNFYTGCELGGASQDGSYAGAYARAFLANGTAVGGESRINESTDGQQGLPHLQIAARPGGGYLAVYNGSRDGVGGCGSENPCLELFARALDSDGVPTAVEQPLNEAEAGTELAPAISFSADGTALVLWESDGKESGLVGNDPLTGRKLKNSRGVIGRRVDAAAVPIGDEFVANVAVQGAQNRASIARQEPDAWITVFRSGGDETEALTPFDECTSSADGCRDGIVARRLVSAVPDCPSVAATDCTSPGKSRLGFRAPAGGKPLFVWKWQNAQSFGGELTSAGGLAGLALCLYDAGDLAADPLFSITPDPDCGTKPCWKERTSTKTAKVSFKRSVGSDKLKLALRSDSVNNAKLLAKAKGVGELGTPDPGALVAPVTVQLRSSTGGCWSSTFATINSGVDSVSASAP